MNNFNINKPVSMVIDETRSQVITALNESKLDAYTLEIVLSDIYRDVKQAANNQKKIERENYEKALQEYVASIALETMDENIKETNIEEVKEPVEEA